MLLREIRTGGDAFPTVQADITHKPDLKAEGYGDTVADRSALTMPMEQR